jgi:hypothetical protein
LKARRKRPPKENILGGHSMGLSASGATVAAPNAYDNFNLDWMLRALIYINEGLTMGSVVEGADDPAVARAFFNFLRSFENAPVLKRKGWEPARQ